MSPNVFLASDSLKALAQEPYEHRGIIHSEMALLLFTARTERLDAIIESGRARGQSTYLMAKYLPEVKIHSVELRDGPDEAFAVNRLSGLPNVMLYMGDGSTALPALAEKLAPARVGILCDGPKGAAAVSVLEACFAHPNVRVGFIHDMRRLDHGGPSPHRAAAIERLPRHLFSDDPDLVKALSWLDTTVLKANGPAGPTHEAEFGSYGPTLGVFFNHILKGVPGDGHQHRP